MRVPVQAVETFAQAFSKVKLWDSWSFPLVSPGGSAQQVPWKHEL